MTGRLITAPTPIAMNSRWAPVGMRASSGLGLGGFPAVPALISLAREETVDGNILVQFVPVDSPRVELVVGTRFAGRRE